MLIEISVWRNVRLFFCAKKIVYLHLYERGERRGSAGFAGIYGEKQEVRISIQIKNAVPEKNGEVPVFLLTKGQEISMGNMKLTAGCGSCERRFALRGDKMLIGSHCVGAEEVAGIRAVPDGEWVIEGRWMQNSQEAVPAVRSKADGSENKTKAAATAKAATAVKAAAAAKNADEAKEPRREPFKREILAAQESGRMREQEDIAGESEQICAPYLAGCFGDKWEMLQSQYKRMHPFGDDREFVSIELKDFVVLGQRCQKLINNSFLLHGFYNYRHLILGKDCRIGGCGDMCFYLGVPGVFFEREKMVAVMFGFEGFECAGPVEIGKFGYYLRSVEL